jgi:hypothetical protein
VGYSRTGKNADPEFRRERAIHAALTRNTLDHHVKAIVDRAPELSAEQRDKLAVLIEVA